MASVAPTKSVAASTETVLQTRDLSLTFPRIYGDQPLLQDITIEVSRGEVLGVVGESGCGKTLLGLTLLGLEPGSAVVEGEVWLGDLPLRDLSSREMREIRGRRMSMVYQDALTSLNPGMTIGAQLEQVCQGTDREPRDLLELVQLAGLTTRLKAYPYQLSGGQRQRVLLALALAGEPELLVADEPTTALDVTVQAEILKLLDSLRRDLQLAVVLISHDFGVMAEIADRVGVMYAGQLVEVAPTAALLRAPSHPYTLGLVEALRSLERRRSELTQIPGSVPTPRAYPEGCRFRGRCPRESERCQVTPELTEQGPERRVACYHPDA